MLALRVADRANVPRRRPARCSGLGPGGGNVDNNTGEITIPVGSDGTAILTEAVRRLDAEGIRLADIGLRRPTLDDVFLALTGHAAEGGTERRGRPRTGTALEEAEARQGARRTDMSAITETLRQPGRLSATVSDWWVLTRRNLLTYIRKPDLLVFSTIQPVMFVLLFVYVFGGAFELSSRQTSPTSTS